jgi:hypothetical protein
MQLFIISGFLVFAVWLFSLRRFGARFAPPFRSAVSFRRFGAPNTSNRSFVTLSEAKSLRSHRMTY